MKLPAIGSGVELALIGKRRRPWTEFGSNQPKLGNDGRPREQLVVTGVVVSQQNAVVGEGAGVDRPVQIGEVVSAWLHSHNWASYIDAERANGGVNVGDVMLWHYTHDEPPTQGGNNPRKVRKVSLRRAHPNEAAAAQRAEALYYEMGFDRPDEPQQPAQPGPFDQPAQQSPYGQPVPQPQAPYGAPGQSPAYGQQQMPYGQQAPAQGPQTPNQQGYPGQPQPEPQPDYTSPTYDPGF